MYEIFEKIGTRKKRILVYNLNGRDTSINSSKHGDSSKYLKSDSNITRAIIHVEHHRDTIIDLRTFRIKYPSNVIIGHLNTSSIRNKFELLSFLIDGKVDIFLIRETKIDGTFPTSQFLMSNFSNVYRLDRNDKGGGIMLFVKDNLITFPVSGFCFLEKTDIFCVELNLRKQKWLIFCCYNPHIHLMKDHLQQIKNAIDYYSKSYENIILIGDFNVEICDSHMDSSCAIYHLKSLTREPTCFKNPEKPTSIDLILTNSPRQFQATQTLETGLSYFHKMTVTVFKPEFLHQKPTLISYRNYKRFDRNNFEKEIKDTLIIQKISPKDFSAFKNIVIKVLNLHAPLKPKHLRANHSSFISKDLRKAIMHRTKLRNQFLKLKTHGSRLRYNKQRNLCVTLLRKAKKKYYTDLKMSDINDNKKFWKNVKPIFGNKNKGNRTTALEEGNEVITDDGKLAQTFNEYFVNIFPSLGITFFFTRIMII